MDPQPSGSKRKSDMPDIDHVAVLAQKKFKQDQEVDYALCILCQTDNTFGLVAPTETGKERVIRVAEERRRLRDVNNIVLLDRLNMLQRLYGSGLEGVNIRWHKNCYGVFTSEGKLKRLRSKGGTASIEQFQELETVPSKCTVSRRSSSEHAIDWAFCMFCQMLSKEPIHNVSTMDVSRRIISLSKSDVTMRVRLANAVDLVAAEGKYHLKCLVKFQRDTDKQQEGGHDSKSYEVDPYMDELCVQLILGLEHGYVYDMDDVWNQYMNMCSRADIHPHQRYLSRRKHFTDDIQKNIGSKASFVRPLDQAASLLLYPSNKSEFAIAKTLENAQQDGDNASVDSADEDMNLPHQNNVLQELVHSALELKKDLTDMPGHSAAWHGIDEAHVEKVIPDSLYLFLSVLFGGTSALEDDTQDEATKRKVCSIAQDIVYNVSKRRKLTPKHIGLGLTLHQATRSEDLVELFHAAGHTVGMDTIRRIDTTVATEVLAKYEMNGYVYIPDNIVPYEPGRLILASCDNIDVLEETIDGKNTFHCTQMMLWQRGPPPERSCVAKTIGRARELKADVLEKLHELDNAKLPVGVRPQPVFHANTTIKVDEWFTVSVERTKAKLKNDAWLLCRLDSGDNNPQDVPSWSGFNEACSSVDPPLTTRGMMPILQAPADNNDTMTTVINRFVGITHHLGQRYTIIEVDQPLYSRGKELVWANQEKYKDVVLLLGHLHIIFNFLKAIGQHVENAGIDDIWVESDLFAQNSTDAMMQGKAYYRAVRGHIWAYEALCRMRWKMFVDWLQITGRTIDVDEHVTKVTQLFEEKRPHDDICDAVHELMEALQDNNIQGLMQLFDRSFAENPNYSYWITYMEMVEVMLDFIRANRDGNWNLHLDAFSAMLPWLTIYDHTNYARWGPVYLAEMKGLESSAPEVFREFVAGNFVVKQAKHKFNQVPIDQATEWQNRMCKVSNGIIGITRNDPARDRFCITWSERSQISHDTKCLYGRIEIEEETAISTRKDNLPSRLKHDEESVKKLVHLFSRFNVFKVNTVPATVDIVQNPSVLGALEMDDIEPEIVPRVDGELVPASLDADQVASNSDFEGSDVEEDNADKEDQEQFIPQFISLATNDVATSEIQTDLLSAKERGEQLVIDNVTARLVNKTVPFYDPLKKHNSKTFGSLYTTTVTNKQNESKTLKADRKLIQQLFNASQAGRKIEMQQVLMHELSIVPLSLAKTSGELNSTSKSDILTTLTKESEVEPTTEVPPPSEHDTSTVLIDGHALIQRLGKPCNCKTFDDYAAVFLKVVVGYVKETVKRIDVVFDTYIKQSIKASTRNKRSGKKKKPIRRIIDRGDVPLPQVWAQFITLNDNKADLAQFLSQYMMQNAKMLPNGCELVTGGGFSDHQRAQSSLRGDIPQLQANHEEADTRLILHACEAIERGKNRVLVVCNDTDVNLLLIHFLGGYRAVEVWMVSGTAKKKKCFPVHRIAQNLPLDIRHNILRFHAFTGCDTVSSFHGFGKKACWKIFREQPDLLASVGQDATVDEVEEFVCRLYGAPDPHGGVNKARYDMFGKGQKSLEKLPPTRDALELHLARSNYQARIWMEASTAVQTVGLPTTSGGWKENVEGALEIVWARLPSVPHACIELVSCGCKTKCKTAACKCNKTKQKCILACEQSGKIV